VTSSLQEAAGPLAPIVNGISELVGRCGDGRYTFWRGPVLYDTWAYETKPWVFSLQIVDSTMFLPINEAHIVFETSTRMNNELVSDGALDEMRGHIYQVICGLRTAVRPGTNRDGLLIGMFPSEGACVEFYDADLRVQGVTFTFKVSF